MFAGEGQVTTEYLMVTATVLVIVTIIFSFAYVNYEQNIRIAKANDALTAMVNTADQVYMLGKGNALFIDVGFPKELEGIYVVNVCSDANQLSCATGTEQSCDCQTQVGEDLNFSAIRFSVKLIGGSDQIQMESKAKLVLSNLAAGQLSSEAVYSVRASWTDTGKIKLERV